MPPPVGKDILKKAEAMRLKRRSERSISFQGSLGRVAKMPWTGRKFNFTFAHLRKTAEQQEEEVGKRKRLFF